MRRLVILAACALIPGLAQANKPLPNVVINDGTLRTRVAVPQIRRIDKPVMGAQMYINGPALSQKLSQMGHGGVKRILGAFAEAPTGQGWKTFRLPFQSPNPADSKSYMALSLPDKSKLTNLYFDGTLKPVNQADFKHGGPGAGFYVLVKTTKGTVVKVNAQSFGQNAVIQRPD